MTINTYVKKWCDEDYKVEKEDFYVTNAKYVAERSWVMGGIKHGIVALAAAIVLGINQGALITALTLLGAMALCFWFFGIRSYCANDSATGAGIYLMLGVVLLVAFFKVSDVAKLIFAIPTCALFVYSSIIRPIKFIGVAIKMRKLVIEEETEEDKDDQETYKGWEAGYKAYRFGLPEPEQTSEDPLLDEAWRLFEGYKDNLQVLKARYRKLAKQHHPDVGGDTQFFQRINYVYEELQKSVV